MVMKTEVIEKNQTDGSATKAAAPMSSINKSSSLSSNKKMRKFKGVRMRSWGSWVSEIRAPNQKTRIWLGSYSTAEAAARAYDAALICLKGPSANLNFPTFSQQNFPLKTNDNLHHHHHITNMSPKNIQKIAAQAANTLLHDNAISSSSTASVASSPSPSNTIEDHNNSLLSQFEEYLKPNETAVLNVMDHSVPWFNNFGSFKFREMIDDMLSFDDQQPPFKMIDNHVYEGEEDLRLWDFC